MHRHPYQLSGGSSPQGSGGWKGGMHRHPWFKTPVNYVTRGEGWQMLSFLTSLDLGRCVSPEPEGAETRPLFTLQTLNPKP